MRGDCVRDAGRVVHVFVLLFASREREVLTMWVRVKRETVESVLRAWVTQDLPFWILF